MAETSYHKYVCISTTEVHDMSFIHIFIIFKHEISYSNHHTEDICWFLDI